MAITNKPGAIIIEGHVQGLSNTRALGEAGYPVYVIDKGNCLARYSKHCKKFFRCPDYQDDRLVDFLIKLAEQENISGWVLIPSNDHAVTTISRNREKLMKCFRFTIPGIDIIDSIYDKSKLLRIAETCDVPVPTTFYPGDSEIDSGILPFPILTKGKHGLSFYQATGKKVFLANSAKEWKDQRRQISKSYDLKNTFSQVLIPFDGTNKTISFTAFCVNGEVKTSWMGVKIREHPLRFGTATLAQSIFCEDLVEPSQRLMKKLNYTGVCEIEYLKDPEDQQYKLIEVNARTWLWVGLAKACGVDFAKMIYNHLNEIENEFPQRYAVGIKWVNYFTDCIFSCKAMVGGKLSVKQYIQSLRGPKINAIHSWRDIKPGVMFLILAFYIAVNR